MILIIWVKSGGLTLCCSVAPVVRPSETQMMPGEVPLGSSKCPPHAAPGPNQLYKVDCIKHLPTLGCTETTDQGPKHSTGENWQTSGAQRLEIRGSNNQLLDSGSDGGGSFHQHSGGARDILSPHRQFMERLASSSTCLLARNCNYYVATWLILDLEWREKCLNNQLVYFNYRKFPDYCQFIMVTWRHEDN